MSDDIELTEEESAAFWEAINPRPIPPPERAILTDLIAELRELNQDRDGGMWADDVHDCADRAEARLKEVQGE